MDQNGQVVVFTFFEDPHSKKTPVVFGASETQSHSIYDVFASGIYSVF